MRRNLNLFNRKIRNLQKFSLKCFAEQNQNQTKSNINNSFNFSQFDKSQTQFFDEELFLVDENDNFSGTISKIDGKNDDLIFN